MITVPMTQALFGGAELAIKGAELQKQIRKADAQEAVDASFEKIWDTSFTALVNLHIEVIRVVKTEEGDGGSIEGMANKVKVKVVAVKLTESITEIGIWTSHDKALANLIAERIREEAHERGDRCSLPGTSFLKPGRMASSNAIALLALPPRTLTG